MDQTRFVQRVRMNQFERVYQRWKEKKLTQAGAAAQLGVTERTFRRYIESDIQTKACKGFWTGVWEQFHTIGLRRGRTRRW